MIVSTMSAQFSISFSLCAAVLTTAVVASGEELSNKPQDVARARTDLYKLFDPEHLGRKYLSEFENRPEFSAVSNFRVTPPNRWFKTFRIKGQAAPDKLTQLADSLQSELERLADSSTVEVVATVGRVDERPIGILKSLCPTYIVKLSSLQGRHISYRQGNTRGDMDLFVFQYLDGDGDDLSWCVLCSVHEPAEPQSDQSRILGAWRVSGSIGGEEIPKEALGAEVEFTADLMILKPKNADGSGDWLTLRYDLDPTHDPKHIDTRHRLSSDEEPFIQRGIYSLENGELRLGLASAGEPRPADFRSIPHAFVLESVEEP
ncbi:TIGR03067 domain-containing protein [candidate division GN15 bacterium]|nr:TIGR03067 domain-containing protein [candidate division GN15 bacterium]